MGEPDRALPGPVIAVVGPTGVGKTTVGEAIAERAGGEVVSADSMQVYRGMDIGTAKQPERMRRVAHHCIDLVDPGTPYTAALYQIEARAAIDALLVRGATPVLVGGTGLYVRAALDELAFPSGEPASASRDALEALAAELGAEALHARLEALDPASAALIHPNNVRRVVRALEMHHDGVSYAEGNARLRQRTPHYDAVQIGLTMERTALYERIDARVHAMAAAGLLDEVARLLESGYREALTATQAIGYKELVPVVEGHMGLDEALDAVARATRRYAKRQLTWFRADRRVRWVDVTGLSTADAADAAYALVQSAMGPFGREC